MVLADMVTIVEVVTTGLDLDLARLATIHSSIDARLAVLGAECCQWSGWCPGRSLDGGAMRKRKEGLSALDCLLGPRQEAATLW